MVSTWGCRKPLDPPGSLCFNFMKKNFASKGKVLTWTDEEHQRKQTELDFRLFHGSSSGLFLPRNLFAASQIYTGCITCGLPVHIRSPSHRKHDVVHCIPSQVNRCRRRLVDAMSVELDRDATHNTTGVTRAWRFVHQALRPCVNVGVASAPNGHPFTESRSCE